MSVSDKEIINKFVNDLKEIKEVSKRMKQQSEDDIVKRLNLIESINLNNQIEGKSYEEVKAILDKKYDQIEEIQRNKELEIKERNETIKSIKEGIEIMKEFENITNNIDPIKESDLINEDNVNNIVNKIVDMMIDNEKKEFDNKVNEINKLRKNVRNNQIIDVDKELRKKREEQRKQEELKKKLGSVINNQYIVNNFNKLEEWSGLKYHQILYDNDIDDKSPQIFRNKIMNHSHLYFIVIDSNDNVFGHYHSTLINKIVFVSHFHHKYMYLKFFFFHIS